MAVPYHKVVIITHADITNDPANPPQKGPLCIATAYPNPPKKSTIRTHFQRFLTPDFPTAPQRRLAPPPVGGAHLLIPVFLMLISVGCRSHEV